MKKIFMASLALTTLGASIALFQMSSCTNPTVYNCPDIQTKTQILVAKTWMIDQLQNKIYGVFGHYVRGGINTTGRNYDINRYKFNSDGTAIYIGEDGNTYTATWKFASSDDRTITFTFYRNGVPNINNWEMVEIAGNYIHVTQHFLGADSLINLHSYRLIQIP